jgi:hypothetical protein
MHKYAESAYIFEYFAFSLVTFIYILREVQYNYIFVKR